MKKSLKVLTLLLLVILVGCSSSKENVNEKEALEAYTATINKINKKAGYDIGVAGGYEVPKSAISKTEVKGEFKIDGYVSKDFNMDFNIAVKQNGVESKIKMLSDSKYLYIGMNDMWQKTKLDSKIFEGINPSKVSSYEDVKKQFSSYESKKYEKVTVDGKEGYNISYVVGLSSLKKSAADEGETNQQKEVMKQLKGLKIKVTMFVPVVPADNLKQTVEFGINMLGVKLNLDSAIDLKSSDSKKIIIPDKAKNAPESQTNFNSLV